MALPATGNQITMLQVRDFFGGTYSPITMSQLGEEISITSGTTVLLSESFGGQSNPQPEIAFEDNFAAFNHNTNNITSLNLGSDGDGDYIQVSWTSTDPQILFYNLGNFDPTVYRYWKVLYRVVSGNAGQLLTYFVSDIDTTPVVTNVVSLSADSGGSLVEAVFDMTTTSSGDWASQGSITGFRFDPGDSSVDTTMNIYRVQLTQSP